MKKGTKKMTETKYNEIKGYINIMGDSYRPSRLAGFIDVSAVTISRIAKSESFEQYLDRTRQEKERFYIAHPELRPGYNKSVGKTSKTPAAQPEPKQPITDVSAELVTKADLHEAVATILNGVQAIVDNPNTSDAQDKDKSARRTAWWLK